jgi:hypothetical protein
MDRDFLLKVLELIVQDGEEKKIGVMEGSPALKTTPSPFVIGQCYLFRCVTYHQIGRVVTQIGNFLVLDDASWLALSADRFHKTIESGEVNEAEYCGRMYVNLEAIVDAEDWNHAVPVPTQ